jgi:6-phosphogluconolactonase
MTMNGIEIFATHEDLAAATADAVADALGGPGGMTFVATGGTTVGPAYDDLARRELDWGDVTITLTDERWVPVGDPLSNEGLIRSRLLTAHAAAAKLLPFKSGPSPDAAADALQAPLEALLPATVTVLGMGVDGHVASLFPADPELAARLAPDGKRLAVGVAEAGLDPKVARISLTGAAVLKSALILMIITGTAKRAVIERIAAEPAYAPPAAAILRQSETPVRVLWAA